MMGTGKLALRLSVFFFYTYLIIKLRYICIHVIFLLKNVLIIELIQHVHYVVIKMFGR